jgi:hypothetical protein
VNSKRREYFAGVIVDRVNAESQISSDCRRSLPREDGGEDAALRLRNGGQVRSLLRMLGYGETGRTERFDRERERHVVG